MMVYNDPGGPQDRGANLDRPFADNNTGFIGSGTRLRRAALQNAKVNPFGVTIASPDAMKGTHANNVTITLVILQMSKPS